MNLIRDKCLICNDETEHLYTFPDFPIYMGSSDSIDLRQDQIWNICKSCGTIQLKELIELDVLYDEPHNPAIGATWKQHNKDFANYILKNRKGPILEIGGGNGKIANEVLQQSPSQTYIIYDKHIYDSCDIKVIFKKEFYNPDTAQNVHGYETIVSSHFVEHMYNPDVYIKSFYHNLAVGDRVIFSLPNITNIITDKFTNGLNFEHTYQLDEKILQYLMNKNGFSLVDCTHYSRYNIFITFMKTDNLIAAISNNYNENKHIWSDFIEYHISNVNHLNKSIKGCLNKFLFGCHVFSQYLLYFGLEESDFLGIIDNDTMKQNRCLYGTGLMTYPSSIIKDLEDVAIIVQAGIYTKEIITNLLSVNGRCKIIK